MQRLFSVVLPLSICFCSGIVCSVAACNTPDRVGRLIYTGCAFFCYYCFFTRLFYRGD